jgi:hypothetical protein
VVAERQAAPAVRPQATEGRASKDFLLLRLPHPTFGLLMDGVVVIKVNA